MRRRRIRLLVEMHADLRGKVLREARDNPLGDARSALAVLLISDEPDCEGVFATEHLVSAHPGRR